MKKRILGLALLAALGFLCFGCSSDDGGPTTPDDGSVVINCTPDDIDAPWSLAGPGGMTAAGQGDSTMTSMDTGDYTVTWGSVAGYTAPAAETRGLSAGSTATFNGAYTEVVASGRIEIDGEPDSIDAPWSLSGPDGFSQSGAGDLDLPGVAVGDYTLTWGDVEEWITPDPAQIMLSLAEGDTIEFYGAYREANPTRGSLMIDAEPDDLNAPWELASSTGFGTSGNGDYEAHGLNPGGYTVTWIEVHGYVTPRQQTLQLVAGDTIRFEVFYEEEDLPPVACFNVDPDEGTTFTNYVFNANCSYDRGGVAGDLRYRWDWENDGVWDFPGGDETTTDVLASHSFDEVATYTVLMEVKDPAGNFDTSTEEVRVDALTTSTVHIDPEPDLPDAPWTLQGPGGYWRNGNGDQSLYDLTEGEYTVTWGQVLGWILLTPQTETRTLVAGEPMTFTCEYDYVGGQVEMSFKRLDPGVFTMGTAELEPYRNPDETQHQVTLTRPINMMTTEVTNQQYIEVAQWAVNNGYATATPTGLYDNLDGSTQELYDLDDADREVDWNGTQFTCINPDNPVQEITWYGAVAFCDWLSLRDDLERAYDHGTWLCNDNSPYAAVGYRLPTEAEWEYACRSGSTAGFSNGEITNPDCADPLLNVMGWYCGNGQGKNHPVGEKQPNNWGLYDMHGNTWEWCNDWKDDLASTPVTDPPGPLEPPSGIESRKKVVRGGSWTHTARDCRSAARYFYDPYYASSTISFRVARTVE